MATALAKFFMAWSYTYHGGKQMKAAIGVGRADRGLPTWLPIESAPVETLVDVLFDPDQCDMPTFYCPEGKVTKLWRVCAVYKNEKGDWFAAGGLEINYPIRIIPTHWMPLPLPPTSDTSEGHHRHVNVGAKSQK